VHFLNRLYEIFGERVVLREQISNPVWNFELLCNSFAPANALATHSTQTHCISTIPRNKGKKIFYQKLEIKNFQIIIDINKKCG
jgi:hypothetical protein